MSLLISFKKLLICGVILSHDVASQSLVSVTSASVNSADGVNTVKVGGSTASVNTVVNDGITTTYRAIYTPSPSVDDAPARIPNIEDPQAIDAQTVCPGYKASNIVQNAHGFTGDLFLAGPACNVYGNDIDALSLAVEYQSADRLSVKIIPKYIDASNHSQYLIPSYYVNEPVLDSKANLSSAANDLHFTWDNEPSFSFSVLRKSTGDTLYSTHGNKLVFEDQFLEFATQMPENYNLYGIGEHIHGLRLGNNYTATIYAADSGDPIDYNIYGSHPFYLDTRYYEINNSTKNMTLLTTNETSEGATYEAYSHGVYLRNAHGQEILMNPSNVTWRTLGGSIDLYFFGGPTQPEVTKQYQTGAVGLPAMQQYFTFGYHQCRWGYQNWTVLENVVENFRKFDIPLENIWTDIDYMNQYRDFENDQNTFNYSQAATFLTQLTSDGQHYIPIVDSAIYHPNPNNASDAYPTYDRGNASDAFMMNPDGSQYIGQVWPGYTVFPDWRSAMTQDWWTNEMSMWHDKVAFSGIWIDMSEVSSFCVGSCGTGLLSINENPVHLPGTLPGEKGAVIYDYPEAFNITNSTEAASASAASSSQSAVLAASSNSASETVYLRTKPTPGARNINYPPYVINNVNGDLSVHAVSPNATHHDGSIEYDVHNLFGYEILNATYNALTSIFPGKRPFIIGRSTFAGSGTVAGHWGGDNYSQWRYMFFSIPQALSFSLFGIPMFGVDTCGFNGNSDEELCNRWMQLSAFFPFYRNHNTLTANSQEPYLWASVAEASRTAMSIRYALLPYIYTLFYQAHTTGSTVMRALSWEFPHDPSLASADRQFLLGPSIMVTPVLEPQMSSVDGVFPGVGTGTIWYDWYTQMAVEAIAGKNTTISAPLGHIPVFIRGGSVLPMQQPGYTTAESRKNQWSLIVAMSSDGAAAGQVYLDDGESISPNATRYVDLKIGNSTLNASSVGTYHDSNSLANVTVLGLAAEPNKVSFDGMNVSGVDYNSTSKVLFIIGLQNLTSGGAWSRDWTLKWS